MYLQFKAVSKIFNNYITGESIVALKNIDLNVDSSELIVISGRNGSGKSTLLRLASQLLKPSSGKIFIDESIKRRLRYCPDNPALYGNITLKNFMQTISHFSRQKFPMVIIKHWLKEFELEKRLKEPIKNLSRGMRYKVALIPTLFDDPQLILLDEPYSSLDEQGSLVLSNHILKSLNNGVSFLISDIKNSIDISPTQKIKL